GVSTISVANVRTGRRCGGDTGCGTDGPRDAEEDRLLHKRAAVAHGCRGTTQLSGIAEGRQELRARRTQASGRTIRRDRGTQRRGAKRATQPAYAGAVQLSQHARGGAVVSRIVHEVGE